MNQPRGVRIIGLWWAIQAVLAVGQMLVMQQNMGIADISPEMETLKYVTIALSGLLLIAALLTAVYRRIGLVIGGLVTAVATLGNGWWLLNPESISLPILIGIAINLLVLGLVVHHLTNRSVTSIDR